MKSLLIVVASVLLVSLGKMPSLAQESNVPASESMHRAGESAKEAATSAGHAVDIPTRELLPP